MVGLRIGRLAVRSISLAPHLSDVRYIVKIGLLLTLFQTHVYL